MSANDRQVGGDHYKTGMEQHWDFAARHFGPGYFKGQITKYISRHARKNGRQDLEKALHFHDKLCETDWLRLGWGWQVTTNETEAIAFAVKLGLPPEEALAFARASTVTPATARDSRATLAELIDLRYPSRHEIAARLGVEETGHE